jgi:hypothetical protein
MEEEEVDFKNKRRGNLYVLEEDEFIFYNKRKNNFEKILRQESVLINKLIAEEKLSKDKSILNSGDINKEYFPDLAYYWDNKPYIIKLIINKLKDDIEIAKKKSNKIKSNKLLNLTLNNISKSSFISNKSPLSSDKNFVIINEQGNNKTDDNNNSVGKKKLINNYLNMNKI